MLIDQDIRNQALDISKSFIVQAPAGSGKTALLTQRLLALLAKAQEPEECLAITFTRKAAAEMRERILLALQEAEQNIPVTKEHELITRKLAKQVLLRDKQSCWNLLENPKRLKIQTIDSLNVSLTHRMPILSGFGAKPKITTNAEELYAIAVEAILNETIVAENYLPYLNIILKHLDNNRALCYKLFISLLPLREQWLPYIVQTKYAKQAKEVLEYGLRSIVLDALQQLVASIPKELAILPGIAAQAASNVVLATKAAPIGNCLALTTWPGKTLSDLAPWLGIASLVFTKERQLRKTLTWAQGFPAPSTTKDKIQQEQLKTHKQQMLTCLDLLAKYPIFCDNLRVLTYLPTINYSPSQWQFIEALVHILPLLVAQLTVVFRNYGQIDLPEVAIAAQNALGCLEAPSDLALALDYKLLHILVDEFQDTSIAQYRLLEQLTAGWTIGDGKTLFLVGDPMQSIYRFRQAEVGLFLNVQQFGLGAIKLESLYLTANFRAAPQLVTWINSIFTKVFPVNTNIFLGEVGYTKSSAVNTAFDGEVQFFCFAQEDLIEEANYISKIIQERRAKAPQETIAILVRSRSHLLQIISKLQQDNIPYQGIEIEALATKPIIQDLLALTKALLYLGDRISWLAILRAPWCGLTLTDLLNLLGENFTGCVWEKLQLFEQCKALTATVKARLQCIVPILQWALVNVERQPLAEVVYITWRSLAGHYCICEQQSLDDVEVFFGLLRDNELQANLFAVDFFTKQLNKLFSKPQALAENAVQIMTIHKAKGLEFDTVILPGLGRKPRGQEVKLFRWEERTSLSGEKQLVFAPIKAVGQLADPIYDFLQYSEGLRDHYELARLIYVATTRARKALFGFGNLFKEQPQSNSMLALLWRYLPANGVQNISGQITKAPFNVQQALYKIPLAIVTASTMPQVTQEIMGSYNKAEHSEFDDWLRKVGIVVHKILWQITIYGIQRWQQLKQEHLEQQWSILLLQQGLAQAKLSESLALVRTAIANILTDETGKWILADTHSQGKAEWALTTILNGEVKQIIIDRTFVDSAGVRWLIDYKICHQTAITTIIPAYKQQLLLYRKVLMQCCHEKLIKIGLYFPLQAQFIRVALEN